MRSFFRRKDEGSGAPHKAVERHEPEEIAQRFIHLDMIGRGEYAIMCVSENDRVIDMIMYKDHVYVGHIDASMDTDVIAAVLASSAPEEFAEFCGGCLGPTRGRYDEITGKRE